MITQIYSIQTVEEALECVEAGEDYIGRKLPACFNVPVMDTIGAGDVFNSGFLSGVVSGAFPFLRQINTVVLLQ